MMKVQGEAVNIEREREDLKYAALEGSAQHVDETSLIRSG